MSTQYLSLFTVCAFVLVGSLVIWYLEVKQRRLKVSKKTPVGLFSGQEVFFPDNVLVKFQSRWPFALKGLSRDYAGTKKGDEFGEYYDLFDQEVLAGKYLVDGAVEGYVSGTSTKDETLEITVAPLFKAKIAVATMVGLAAATMIAVAALIIFVGFV